jgi:hypothetical protein
MHCGLVLSGDVLLLGALLLQVGPSSQQRRHIPLLIWAIICTMSSMASSKSLIGMDVARAIGVSAIIHTSTPSSGRSSSSASKMPRKMLKGSSLTILSLINSLSAASCTRTSLWRTMSSGQGGRRVKSTRVVKNADKTSFTSVTAAINAFRLV